MKRMQFASALGAILALALISIPLQASTPQGVLAQSDVVQFPATGKAVQGQFLAYWNNHGGLTQQGYPISDEFTEISDTDGKSYTVQYFERAVFEKHPENTAPYDTLLSLLGVSLYKQRYPQGAPDQVANTAPGSIAFAQTGHRLGGRFLEYWQTHGGLAQQGYPISDEFTETSAIDGKQYTVQYFERSEFELHPDNAAPYDVLLSLLGSIRYNQSYAPGGATPQPTAQPTQPAVETGSDWPMYGHDAQHTSYSADESLISAANVGQLVSHWQVFLGTNGTPSSSSPSVAGGRVYVGSSVPTGPNFFAFDAKTGAPSWSADLGYQDKCNLVGIGSTASISGTVVAVGGGDAAYYGLNAQTGATLWRNSLNASPGDFAWLSPLLAYGRAYLGVASYCDAPPVRGQIRAVDLLTGQELASQYTVAAGASGGEVWQSPALSPDSSTLVIATGEDQHGNDKHARALMALDPLSLDIRQSDQQGIPGADQDYASSPVIFHDRSNRLLVGASQKDNHYYAYELANINHGAIWSRPIQLSIGMISAYDPTLGDGGALFLAGRDGTLYTVDPATGADIRPPMMVGKMHGNLVIANGLMFINVGEGGLAIYNVNDGQLLRTIVPDHAGKTYSGVALAHGFIYWVAGGYLNAWSLP